MLLTMVYFSYLYIQYKESESSFVHIWNSLLQADPSSSNDDMMPSENGRQIRRVSRWQVAELY